VNPPCVVRVDSTRSPCLRAMTAICAFETFERRLESTLSGHCRSWRWTGSGTRTSLSSFRRTSVVIILGQSRATAWPRKISEKRSGPDRASSLRGCWPRDERSAAIERRGSADVERPPVASPQLKLPVTSGTRITPSI